MQYTNKQGLPAPLVALLTRDLYTKGKSQYSVTELISPPKVRKLRERYDDEITIDVVDLIDSKLGTLLHAKLENQNIEGHILEERIFATVDESIISGQIDLQREQDGGVVVIDYKLVKAYSVMNAKSDWTTQLNIYKWLVETVKKVPVVGLQICAIVKDWSQHEKREGYPEAKAVMIDIPMMDNVEIETYIRSRLALHIDAEVSQDLGVDIKPCTPEERWMTETTYAVRRDGRQTAMRVFKSLDEAEAFMGDFKDRSIEERPGEPRRCKGNYCYVAQWCKQYQSELKAKENQA